MYLDMLERAVAGAEGRARAGARQAAGGGYRGRTACAGLPAGGLRRRCACRLGLYKRIAAAEAAGLEELTAELVDRFGELPPAAANLLKVARLKMRSRGLGVRRLDLGTTGGYVLFEEKNTLDPAVIIRLIQKHPRELRLEGSLRIRVAAALEAVEKRFDYAQELLQRFSGRSA